jgi:hypothetical protein
VASPRDIDLFQPARDVDVQVTPESGGRNGALVRHSAGVIMVRPRPNPAGTSWCGRCGSRTTRPAGCRSAQCHPRAGRCRRWCHRASRQRRSRQFGVDGAGGRDPHLYIGIPRGLANRNHIYWTLLASDVTACWAMTMVTPRRPMVLVSAATLAAELAADARHSSVLDDGGAGRNGKYFHFEPSLIVTSCRSETPA